MALDRVRALRKELSDEEKNTFENLLKDAWDKPWWRRFVTEIERRNSIKLNMLVSQLLGQREEDILRGNIQELNFILNLDERGAVLNEQKEKERRNG